MAPFGHDFVAFDMILWPLIMGVVALVGFKYVSNQAAIARAKSQITMHLLEIRLFSHDIVQVLKSTGHIVLKNGVYVGNNLLPMIVIMPPMIALMTQLVAHYAYAPSPTGAVELLHLELDPAANIAPADVSLALPKGVSLDAPVVHTADGQTFWRLRADAPGDHVLHIDVAGERYEKAWAVGGEARKIPVMRLRSWEALLYPGEAALPSSSPVVSLALETHTRPLAYFPEGEFGILMWAFVVSFVAAFALRGVFGVTF